MGGVGVKEIIKWEESDEDAYKAAILGIILLALSGAALYFNRFEFASFFVVLAIFELQMAANYFTNKKIVGLLSSIDQKLSILVEEVREHGAKSKER